jgi:S1-C subfamily serine protease
VIKMREDSGFLPYSDSGTRAAGGHSAGSAGGYRPSPPPRRRALMTHLAVAVLAAGAATGVTLGLDRPAAPAGASAAALPGSGAVPSPAASAAASPAAGGGTGNAEQQVVNKVEPGLVVVNTTMQYNGEAGAGTGMVINPDGLVLTNNHVIEGSTKITATVAATGKTYPATVIGYDKTADIALIQLQGAAGLRTVPVGNSATVKDGEQVVALGNAEGQGTLIPAAGQITGTGTSITAADQGGTAATETLHGMIATSAGIVPGDSGGPLSTAAGQVIGMDTAGDSVSPAQPAAGQQQTATGFAIPIDTALAVARQIAAGHASSTVSVGYPPFIGIFTPGGSQSSPLAQAQAQEQQNGFGDGFGGFGGFNGFGPPAAVPACYTSNTDLTVPSAIAPVSTGALVDGTVCGSPAATAGLAGGSVITAVNGTPVTSPDSLTAILARFRPGTTISVTWTSPLGKQATSSLHLTAGPPQ